MSEAVLSHSIGPLIVPFYPAIIMSMIMQAIYPIRPHSYRQEELVRTERLLDKWYIELPEHLRFDPSSPKFMSQPPHVLTLHMQYWCTVLLLHRPLCVGIFLPAYSRSHTRYSIRHLSNATNKGFVTFILSRDQRV